MHLDDKTLGGAPSKVLRHLFDAKQGWAAFHCCWLAPTPKMIGSAGAVLATATDKTLMRENVSDRPDFLRPDHRTVTLRPVHTTDPQQAIALKSEHLIEHRVACNRCHEVTRSIGGTRPASRLNHRRWGKRDCHVSTF